MPVTAAQRNVVTRSVHNLASGKPITDAADPSNGGNFFSRLIYTLFKVGPLKAKGEAQTQANQEILDYNFVDIAKAFVNSQADQSGNHDFPVALKLDRNSEDTSAFTITYDNKTKILSCQFENEQPKTVTVNSFEELQLAAIKAYITSTRVNGGQPDLRGFNLNHLDATDLKSLDLKDCLVNGEQASKLIANPTLECATNCDYLSEIIELPPESENMPIRLKAVYSNISFANKTIKLTTDDPVYLEKCDLANAKMEDLDLTHVKVPTNPKSVIGLSLKGSILTKEWLLFALKHGLSLEGTTLKNADLTDVPVPSKKIDVKNMKLVHVSLNAEWVSFALNNSISLQDANLSGVDFSQVRLPKNANAARDINLTGAKLNLAWFLFARANGLSLKDVRLDGIDFKHVNPPSGNEEFTDVNFKGVKFSTAWARWYIDRGQRFDGIDLTNAHIPENAKNCADLQLAGAKLSLEWLQIAMQKQLNITGCDLTAVKIPLMNAELRELPLSGKKLNREWVKFAIKYNMSLQGANLEGADLRGLNLAGANLTAANLTGANLTGANLTGANLTAANLMDAILKGAKFDRAGLVAAIKSREIIKDGKRVELNLRGIVLVGSKAKPFDASNLDFTRADLRGAKFFHCNFKDSKLIETNLSDVDLSTSNLAFSSIDRCITSKNDRAPYIQQLKARISFLLTNQPLPTDDDMKKVDPENLEDIRRIFNFENFTAKTFDQGLTNDDGGAQNLGTTDNKGEIIIDTRTFNTVGLSETQQNALIDTATSNLLGDGFDVNQKRLFYLARQMAWGLGMLERTIQMYIGADHDEMVDKVAKFDLYTKNLSQGYGATLRFGIECNEIVFEIAKDILKEKYPEMSEEKIKSVKDFYFNELYDW